MTQTFGFRFMAFSICVYLAACSDYAVKFNDRTVYTPKPLFSDYQIADAALENCIQQTIIDVQVLNLEDLKQVVCTNGGIKSLDGLETFRFVEQLNLAHNLIREIDPLQAMPNLQVVDVSFNAIQDIHPVTALPDLKAIKLRGNPDLPCAQLGLLASAEVTAPEQCDH